MHLQLLPHNSEAVFQTYNVRVHQSMIAPFLPLIANVLSVLIDKFITDAKKKEEYRLAVLQSLSRYNISVLDSAKLRTEYERLKKEVKLNDP